MDQTRSARGRARSCALVPLLLALAGVGCGSEPSPPPATTAAESPAQPPAPSPAVPAPEPLAETPEWTGELPAAFPADVPQYPGSRIASARGSEDLGVAVTFDSPDAVDVVAKFYSDGLAASGWMAQTEQLPEGTMIIAQKEERRAHALIHPGGQGTLVEIIVVREQ